MNKKFLVAYFSASGTTKRAATMLARAADADLFEIVPKMTYTVADLDWTNKKSRSTLEMSDPMSRPEIKNNLADMANYNVVFIGFPIWWYTAPTIIKTFLESYDFEGKTVIPFATSGGSGLGKTESALKPCAPTAVWKTGKLLNNINENSLKNWIEDLNL